MGQRQTRQGRPTFGATVLRECYRGLNRGLPWHYPEYYIALPWTPGGSYRGEWSAGTRYTGEQIDVDISLLKLI
ncbi:hypothetical protein TWF730_007958 [Orbilia blumenaviensis]|uniref:Uncharacterized protein n=1 Tax=Orbilia blumenaviensis TaxID=1796055 RepID=A0AAV9V9E2_9PEZI